MQTLQDSEKKPHIRIWSRTIIITLQVAWKLLSDLTPLLAAFPSLFFQVPSNPLSHPPLPPISLPPHLKIGDHSPQFSYPPNSTPSYLKASSRRTPPPPPLGFGNPCTASAVSSSKLSFTKQNQQQIFVLSCSPVQAGDLPPFVKDRGRELLGVELIRLPVV